MKVTIKKRDLTLTG